MKMKAFQTNCTYGFAMIVLATLLGSGSTAAFGGSKPSAPAKSAPAKAAPAKAAPARPATASKPGGASAGASRGAGASTASKGPTANGSKGPTANGGASKGPTANGAGAGHGGATGSSAAGHGGASGNTAGAHNVPKGTTASHSSIKSPAPKGANDHVAKDGSAVRTRSNGKVSDVHDAKRGMDVHHGLDGGRRVSVQRRDGSHLVAERGRRGYVERGYHYHGHDFARRSYYWHGHEYGRFYRGYGYRGMYLNVYAPGFYFGAPFYGWAYNPWAVPIAYGWGWGGSPWLGFYGGFFTPWSVYPSASFWLTDYIISQDLQAAYAAHQEAVAVAGDAAAGGPPALSPEVKQQIADEVKAQLALENQEAAQTAQNKDVDAGSSGIARLLGDGHPHVFVVGSGLDLTDDSGQECAVSEGDALSLQTPPPADATTANLVVLASKGGQECHSGGTVAVNLTDLQEMQNHLRETIDVGLKELQDKQGKGGLPQAPASAQAAPVASPYAAVAPPPDPQDAADIQQQAQQADQAEKEVTAAASADGGTPIAAPDPSAPPATVALGQTPDQVVAALGQPTRKADLPGKLIYFYSGMKVTFKGGKVSDVE